MDKEEQFISTVQELLKQYWDLTSSTNEHYKFALAQKIAKKDLYRFDDLVDLLEWARYLERTELNS